MKRFLFAPLAVAAVLCSTVAATAAPFPHHPTPREQAERARWEATHRPAPRPVYHPAYHRPVPPPRPLPAPHPEPPRWDAHRR